MPTLLSALIERSVTPEIYATFPKSEKTRIEAYFGAYLCGCIDSKELGRNVEYRYASVIRERAAHSFVFMVRYKMAILKAIRMQPNARVAVFKDFGLNKVDANIIEYMKAHKLYSRVLAYARSIPRERLVSPQMVVKKTGEVIRTVRNTIKSTSYKRLAIVAKSNNFDMADMEGDLIDRAIQIVYRKFPVIDGQHLINSVRRGVVNAALNNIYYYQRGKRARYFYTDKTSGATEQAIHLSDVSQVFKDSNEAHTLKSNMEDDLHALIDDKNKSTKKQAIAMSLLSLEPSKKFDAYLKAQGMENTDAKYIIKKFGANAYSEFVRRFLKLKKSTYIKMVKRGYTTNNGSLDASGFAISS